MIRLHVLPHALLRTSHEAETLPHHPPALRPKAEPRVGISFCTEGRSRCRAGPHRGQVPVFLPPQTAPRSIETTPACSNGTQAGVIRCFTTTSEHPARTSRILEMPDDVRLGPRDRYRQNVAFGHPELDHVGAVVLRVVDHDAVLVDQPNRPRPFCIARLPCCGDMKSAQR
jgi:hypothetical protein